MRLFVLGAVLTGLTVLADSYFSLNYLMKQMSNNESVTMNVYLSQQTNGELVTVSGSIGGIAMVVGLGSIIAQKIKERKIKVV